VLPLIKQWLHLIRIVIAMVHKWITSDWSSKASRNSRNSHSTLDAPISHHSKYKPVLLAIFYLGLLSLGFFRLAQSTYAAIELNYFEILVENGEVVAEWSTASEHTLLGFDLLYKEEGESQSQYRKIGEEVAQGNADSGATYQIMLTDYLSAATSYCFRLKEVTLNEERGEIIDRCGYGLYITPTPTTVVIDITDINTTANITETTSPTVTSVVTDTGLGSPILEQPPIITTTPVPPLQEQPPLEITATVGVAPITATVVSSSTLPIVPENGVESPLPTPTPQAESSENSSIVTETLDNSMARNVTAASQEIPTATTASNPPYIILTVTPTRDMIALLPTFTPFPTAKAVENPNVVLAILPNTQNLMIVLLCGVFSAASGLGILGLVTTLLYMRSRSSSDPRGTEKYPRSRK